MDCRSPTETGDSALTYSLSSDLPTTGSPVDEIQSSSRPIGKDRMRMRSPSNTTILPCNSASSKRSRLVSRSRSCCSGQRVVFRRIVQCLANIIRFEIGIGSENFLLAHILGNHSHDGRHRDTQSPNTGDTPIWAEFTVMRVYLIRLLARVLST